jgi:hypothetical protein
VVPDRLTVGERCLNKVRTLVENSERAHVDGMLVRKGDWMCVITSAGRCEWFPVNPWGGVRPHVEAEDGG